MRLVVFGWGNESRGDDALGPLLLRRVEAAGFAGVTAVEDYQLQVEHALDLDDADMALFIDAARNAAAPFAFSEISAKADAGYTTHALAPEAVLEVFKHLRKREPPPSFLLAVRGEGFELGAELSEPAKLGLEAAWGFVGGLLKEPDADAWRRACSRGR